MNAYLRYLALGVGISFAQNAHSESISFSELLHDVDRGQVHNVLIEGSSISGTYNDGRTFDTYAGDDPTLVQRLYAKRVSVTARAPSNSAPWYISLLASWLPLIAIIGLWIFAVRYIQKTGGRALGFTQSPAKLMAEGHSRVTFQDVAGVDEARSELQEIVEFLCDPEKFRKLGGRIPRGVLLVGSPGVGKT